MNSTDYNIITNIGKGRYSNVTCVSKNNNLYAMKTFTQEDEENGVSYDFIREVSILKCIKCPYIISLLDIDYTNFKYMITSYYPNSLSLFMKNNMLNDDQIHIIFHKICLGLYTLHSKGIVHRDMKPSNICISETHSNNLTKDTRIVIIDKGMSRKMNYNRNFGERTPKISTVWYRSPEVICKDSNYSFEIDIWSVGCMLGGMYLKKHLFPYDSELVVLKKQAELVGTPKNFSNEMTKFLIPDCEGELYKIFFEHGEDIYKLLEGMLKFDPCERFSIAECLNSSYFIKQEFSKRQETKDQYEYYIDQWNFPIYYNNSVNDIITFKMRRILVAWMFEICSSYKFSDSTYYTSIMLLDYFSLKTDFHINKTNYQLVGIGCLLIASKLESVHTFSIIHLLDLCKNGNIDTYTKKEVLEMEKIILRSSQFDLIFPNISNYYSVYLEDIEEEEKKIKFYLTICTLEPDYLKYNFAILVGICYNLATLKEIILEEDYDFKEKQKFLYCKDDVKKWINNYYQNPIECISKHFNYI